MAVAKMAKMDKSGGSPGRWPEMALMLMLENQAMASSLIDDLEPVPASDVKKRGWRGLHDRIVGSVSGTLLVRNHSRPEGVLMSVETYERLVLEARGRRRPDDRIEALTQAFSERLADLRTPQGAMKLREALDSPLEFDRDVHPGESC